MPKDVNQTRQKIQDMISENPKITQTVMAEKLDVTSGANPENPTKMLEIIAKLLYNQGKSNRKQNNNVSI